MSLGSSLDFKGKVSILITKPQMSGFPENISYFSLKRKFALTSTCTSHTTENFLQMHSNPE